MNIKTQSQSSVFTTKKHHQIKVNHLVVTNKHTDGNGCGNTAIEKYLQSFEERNQTFYNHVLISTKFNVSFKILLCKNFSLKRGGGHLLSQRLFDILKYNLP